MIGSFNNSAVTPLLIIVELNLPAGILSILTVSISCSTISPSKKDFLSPSW